MLSLKRAVTEGDVMIVSEEQRVLPSCSRYVQIRKGDLAPKSGCATPYNCRRFPIC